MTDPELSAMQIIADAMHPLSAADQKRIARWSMPSRPVEVKTQAAVLAILEPLSEPQRQRVIRWTVSRFSGPASTKQGRPKAKDRAVDLRHTEAAA